MLGSSWECHKVREFALRPMGDFFTGVGPYLANRTESHPLTTQNQLL